MGFQPVNNPCPCESGRDYTLCCANATFSGLNFVLDVRTGTDINNKNDSSREFLLENEDKFLNIMDDSIRQFFQSPSLFPVTIDFINDNVEIVKMSPFWYEESTFLDKARIQGRCAIKADLAWLTKQVFNIGSDDDDIKKISSYEISPFIFHSAFCGSTLMMNALTLLYDTLPLREPEILGNLMNYELMLDTQSVSQPSQAILFAKKKLELKLYRNIVMSLLARRYDHRQTPVVKANDLQNAYLQTLIQYQPDAPILIMYTDLNDFIFGCVKTDERKKWIDDRFTYCYSYFQTRFNLFPDVEVTLLDELNVDVGLENHAKKAAAYWAFNMMLYLESIKISPDQIKTLNFNEMLKKPQESIVACAKWFNLDVLSGVNQKHEIKWLMGQHAKNPTQTYSPAQRQEEVDAVLSEYGHLLADANTLAQYLLCDCFKGEFPDDGLPNKLDLAVS